MRSHQVHAALFSSDDARPHARAGLRQLRAVDELRLIYADQGMAVSPDRLQDEIDFHERLLSFLETSTAEAFVPADVEALGSLSWPVHLRRRLRSLQFQLLVVRWVDYLQ